MFEKQGGENTFAENDKLEEANLLNYYGKNFFLWRSKEGQERENEQVKKREKACFELNSIEIW